MNPNHVLPNDDLYDALQQRNIKQVQWAMSNGADPRAHIGRTSLIEHAAGMGFSQAVQCMHQRALSLACQEQPYPPPTDNPYGEDRPSNLISAAIRGADGALLALAQTDIPFYSNQMSDVLYATLDPEHPDRWRNVLPLVAEHFIGRLVKSPLPQCAASLIAPRITVYPRQAWDFMLDKGWVEPSALLRLSRHRSSMKSWANMLVSLEDTGQVESSHMVERLEWLCLAGFDPKPLAGLIESGPLSQVPAYQRSTERSRVVPILRILEQKISLDSGTLMPTGQASPRPTRL